MTTLGDYPPPLSLVMMCSCLLLNGNLPYMSREMYVCLPYTVMKFAQFSIQGNVRYRAGTHDPDDYAWVS